MSAERHRHRFERRCPCIGAVAWDPSAPHWLDERGRCVELSKGFACRDCGETTLDPIAWRREAVAAGRFFRGSTAASSSRGAA